MAQNTKKVWFSGQIIAAQANGAVWIRQADGTELGGVTYGEFQIGEFVAYRVLDGVAVGSLGAGSQCERLRLACRRRKIGGR